MINYLLLLLLLPVGVTGGDNSGDSIIAISQGALTDDGDGIFFSSGDAIVSPPISMKLQMHDLPSKTDDCNCDDSRDTLYWQCLEITHSCLVMNCGTPFLRYAWDRIPGRWDFTTKTACDTAWGWGVRQEPNEWYYEWVADAIWGDWLQPGSAPDSCFDICRIQRLDNIKCHEDTTWAKKEPIWRDDE